MQRSTSTAVLRHFAGNAIVTLLAAWWVIFGIEFLIEGFSPGPQTTSAVSAFPVYISIGVGVLYVTGGAITLWGLYTCDTDLSKVFQWKKVGYTLAAFAGGIYAFYTLKYVPLELVALSFGLMHMTLGVAGLWTTMYSEGSERRKRTTPQGEL